MPDARPHSGRTAGSRLLWVRIVALLTVALGINYVAWRWWASINWTNWWIAVPLVLAETYSLIDVGLFSLTAWRSGTRRNPPPAPPGLTVDVFIATYNEELDLVMATAEAAKRIRYPHETWILDDGARPELAARAEAAQVGYLTRGPEWEGRPRHAKAGNINNALMQTSGEFVLILDADMVPRPEILDRTLGYFDDDRVALVQTPQIFSNVATGDPLGSQAPLFYGPIQEGKDGWNAAFFCGSNAVLRREALMHLGLIGYVRQTEQDVARRLRQATLIVRRTLARTRPGPGRTMLTAALSALREASGALANGEPAAEVTYTLRERVNEAARTVVSADVAAMRGDLIALGLDQEDDGADLDELVERLAQRDLSPLNAMEAVRVTLDAIDVGRTEEAQPLLPLATISVTEDMATSMRLHANGWKSVFHNELLADGLAPEDLGTMLTQRLRWAQGTMQVFLRENPLFVRGMNLAQRLMYFSTMWSYLSGFATVVYLAAPVFFLCFGVLPVRSYAPTFFLHFIPFLAASQLLFLIAARGLPTWRGQQYNLALFPLWIEACLSAAGNVFFRLPLNFAVTPKSRVHSDGLQLSRIRWQIVAAAVLVVAVVVGIIRDEQMHNEIAGSIVNFAWIGYSLISLSVLAGAARYRGYVPEEQRIE
ncbi:glycosyltransferase [Gryllotalpicola ginsengisoli]|uniref:glycosyltransferase n=1 Tax=Gryllotalpicola ginsengisoli TaxID=444608 RepID=UPI000686B027|nr:glycosyltransferase [Gryllotalpicola ginsengisoli]